MPRVQHQPQPPTAKRRRRREKDEGEEEEEEGEAAGRLASALGPPTLPVKRVSAGWCRFGPVEVNAPQN